MSKNNKWPVEISTAELRDKISRIIGLYRCLFLLMEESKEELIAYVSPAQIDLYLQIEDELENLEEMLKSFSRNINVK